MVDESNSRVLRPLGPWELFSSARHHLGIYRCVVVSVRYEIPLGLDNVRAALVKALASMVVEQPMLQVGIVGQETNDAAFVHLPEIDLHDHFELRSLQPMTVEEYETQLSNTQGWLHDQFWPNLESKAPWKVVVLQPESSQLFPKPVIDILLAYHHSLADGTSGKNFHQLLGAALNTQDHDEIPLEPQYTLSFPDIPELPEPQEQAIPFKNSFGFMIRAAWDHLAPSLFKSKPPTPWTGHHIDFSLPYITRVHPIHFSHESAQSILKTSREHSASLTTVIHAMVLGSLAARLGPEQAESFVLMTPINLRPWISSVVKEGLKGKMRSLVTGLETPISPSVVGALRSPHAPRDKLLWQIAKDIKSAFNQRVSTLPSDDAAGLLYLISDLHAYFRDLDGRPRTSTWEISNLGALKSGDPNGGWEPIRGMFTNGAMVAGAGIGVNIISIDKGMLTVTFSWQQGVIEESLIMGLAQDLAQFVSRIHESGQFYQ